MKRKKLSETERALAIERALRGLLSARGNLRDAGAPRAAAAVQRAVRSVESALRHAYYRSDVDWERRHNPFWRERD